eukprot:TRINITY_DN29965_c0_g1_i3.p1 TRINITY_DN29965_c0_g1~~TRINITY_DN29965_c0_g1_i3.p1  ORF type:complete len:508 (-),score=100.25 TRINITY_DN29965_c0_g1_i3:220-1743(-)
MAKFCVEDIASSSGDARDDAFSQSLQKGGLAEAAVPSKRAMFAAAARRLRDEGVSKESEALAFWVPGRIEVAGKHTDYAGGRSLLAATTKGFAVVALPRADNVCRIFTAFGMSRERKSAVLHISKDLEAEQGHWSAYPAAVIRRLAKNFQISKGADIAVECDLPESSGMSTSSAVICYMWCVLAHTNSIEDTTAYKTHLSSPEELYSYLGFIENGQDAPGLPGDKGVGTFGGSEDHTAIMSCRPNELRMYSYCPTKDEGVFPFSEAAVFVVAVSGALAEKTGDAMADYNNAAFLARDAAAAWCVAETKRRGMLPSETFLEGKPNLAEIVRHKRKLDGNGDSDIGKQAKRLRLEIGECIADVDDGKTYGPSGADSSVKYKAGALRERFEHFFDESEEIVAQLADAIKKADWERVGRLSDESHRLTVEQLRNTVPETAWLPREARRLGALGASAFGAGFGGSCWAIVRAGDAAAFSRQWQDAYNKEFPSCSSRSSFFAMSPGPGAFRVI